MGMREAMIIVPNEHAFGQKNVIPESDRAGARHEGKASDLVLASDLDSRFIAVVGRIEIASVFLVNIIQQEAQVAECIDMASFAYRGDVADRDKLWIEDAQRW